MAPRPGALGLRLAGLLLAAGVAAGPLLGGAAGPAGAAAIPPRAPTHEASSGWLHTKGTAIVDSRGEAVQLTGLNVTGLAGTNPQGSDVPGVCNDAWKVITPAEVAQIAHYGFKTVRLPIAWADVEPTAPQAGAGGSLDHTWNTVYLDAVRSDIALFGRHGMRVILDMHQSTWSTSFTTTANSQRPGCPGSGMPEWLNPAAASENFNQARCAFLADRTEPGVPGTAWTDFEAAWHEVAQRVAGTPTVVGLDVLNEPTCEHVQLNAFYSAVLPPLHAAAPHALLIVEDKDDPGTFELTQLPKVPNVVLSIHLHEDYWKVPGAGQVPLPYSAESALAANVARAQHFGVPLYVGEFYAFDASGVQPALSHQRDANFAVDTRAFSAYAADHDVSWTFWAWIQRKDFSHQTALSGGVSSALASGVAVR
jgi:hypothetical protein